MAKRLNLLIKGKSLINELLKIKEGKIDRAINAASDFAHEQALKFEEEKLLLAKNVCDSADDPDKLKEAINAFCDAREAKEVWEKKAQYVAELKACLEEEVEESSEE